MIKENSILIERDSAFNYNRICWSAIFAGAIVGVGLVFLLHLYGIAIGLSAYSSTAKGAAVISIGGLLGILLGVIASMGAAGFLAGYLGRFHYSSLHGSVIYGFVTWSLILLISALCAGPMAHYVSSYGQALSQTTTIETPLVQVKDDKVKNSSPAVKTEDNSNASPTPMVVTPTELAWGGWVIFLLFFVGALSCCIGAGCGMQCKCEKTLD